MISEMNERQRRYRQHVYDMWLKRLTDGSALAKDGRTPEQVAEVLADNAVRSATQYGYPRGF